MGVPGGVGKQPSFPQRQIRTVQTPPPSVVFRHGMLPPHLKTLGHVPQSLQCSSSMASLQRAFSHFFLGLLTPPADLSICQPQNKQLAGSLLKTLPVPASAPTDEATDSQLCQPLA